MTLHKSSSDKSARVIIGLLIISFSVLSQQIAAAEPVAQGMSEMAKETMSAMTTCQVGAGGGITMKTAYQKC